MNAISAENITAVILAGGKGRRFSGNDKGLIVFKQKRLIEHLLEAIAPQVSHIMINANRNQEIYESFGYPVISDAMSDFQGPLAGFSVAMSHVTTSHIITLPCDGPFMSADYVARMCDTLNQQQAELAVAHDGSRLQPVHALMPITLKASLDDFLQSGDRKIDRWYAHHKVAEVDFSDTPEIFQNINTKEQLSELESQDQSLDQNHSLDKVEHPIPLLGFAAWSGTGKTTLLTKLIPLLNAKNLKVGLIKHAHHTFNIDHPSKDSYRLREAGAAQVIIASKNCTATIMDTTGNDIEPRLKDALQAINNTQQLDLLLIEGFKKAAIPKIELHREALGKPYLYPDDPLIIALAEDSDSSNENSNKSVDKSADTALPLLDLNQPEQIADYIQSWLKDVLNNKNS